jgi:hypothetical protein
MHGTFQAFYASELQGLWALLPVPALFLAWLAGPGRRHARASGRPQAGFAAAYCAWFGALSLLDPLATGPLARALALPGWAASALLFLFVWLGDFRVFALVFGLAEPRPDHPWLRAALWTCLVPALDLALTFGILRALVPDLPGQVLWLVHELGFLALALYARARLVPRLCAEEPAGQRRFLRRALAYVALYYALWAAADVLILAGRDAGWLLRVLPNQLYYAWWAPFVFAAFFGLNRAAGPRAGRA